jgi:CRISPR-associated endoribonuclease Cas6
VRVKLRLIAAQDQRYDNDYNYRVQSFIYNLIRNSKFHNIHDSTLKTIDSITPFCFSNIFPHGDMKKGDVKNLIISSPDNTFISLIFNKLKNSIPSLKFGRLEFELDSLRVFQLKTSYPQKVHTATPIMTRIPEQEYRHYDLQLKHPFKYIFWRHTYPLELLLKQLENNLVKKFVLYFNRTPHSRLSFNKLIFRKQIAKKLTMHGSIQTVIGTVWEFWFDELNELSEFAFDSGLGERNRLGFGFLNPC